MAQSLFGVSVSIAAWIQLRNKPGKAEVLLTLNVLVMGLYYLVGVTVSYGALVSMRDELPNRHHGDRSLDPDSSTLWNRWSTHLPQVAHAASQVVYP